MTAISRRRMLTITGALGTALGPRLVWAQAAWPATTRIIVPGPAGGPVDLISRRLGDKLATALATTVVVENKPGAAGLLGFKAAAGAAPDGSTLAYVHSGHLTLQAMGGRLDVLQEMRPVSKVSASPFVLAVPAASPFKTQADLLADLKARPGKLNYGTGGIGSPAHLAFERLSDRVPGGLQAQQIPFKGATETVVSLVSGDIDFTISLVGALVDHIKSGRVRALSVTTAERLSAMPNLPTVAEAGVPGFEFEAWGSLMLPAKASDELVNRLAGAIKAGVATPEVAELMARMGSHASTGATPAQFAAQLRAELATETALAKRLGLKAGG